MALDYKQTGKRLKLVRGRVTQEVFAATLGVSASYVKKTELGGKPSLKYLTNIASTYDVSLDWLLLGTEPPSWAGTPAKQPKIMSEQNAQYETPAGQLDQAELDDPELAEMLHTLTTVMRSGDPDLRSWVKIQFRHAFHPYTVKKGEPPSAKKPL
jgi:transcriptional regulator with XRE-family HTH domain